MHRAARREAGGVRGGKAHESFVLVGFHSLFLSRVTPYVVGSVPINLCGGVSSHLRRGLGVTTRGS